MFRNISTAPASSELTAPAHVIVTTPRRAHSGPGGYDAAWSARVPPRPAAQILRHDDNTVGPRHAVVAATVGDRIASVLHCRGRIASVLATTPPATATAAAAVIARARRPGAETTRKRTAAAATHRRGASRRKTRRRTQFLART